MTYPLKYIKLIEYLLLKRDNTRGGVEGFTTPIFFTLEEVCKELTLTRSDVIEMLKHINKEEVDIKSDLSEAGFITKPVFRKFIQINNGIEIIASSTETLGVYLKEVKSKTKTSSIKIEKPRNRKEVVHGNSKHIFNKGNAFRVFEYIHGNYPELVNYEAIAEIMKLTHVPILTGENKKKIQNTVDNINRELKTKFRLKVIEPVRGKGYKLVV